MALKCRLEALDFACMQRKCVVIDASLSLLVRTSETHLLGELRHKSDVFIIMLVRYKS